jgi:hypothetical protein
VLQARECAPTPYSFVVFTSDSHLSLSRRLGVHHFWQQFQIKYEQLFKAYNGGHCGMVLIKNVTTTIKGDQYLKAQHYTILTKVVE